MKIISLISRTQTDEIGLDSAVSAIYDIFSELGIDVLEIDLRQLNLPLYNKTFNDDFLNALDKIENYGGIMIATASNLFGPSPDLFNFLTYLENYREKNIFQNKNCLVLAVSKTEGEKNTLDYLSRYINYFEGFDSVKIGMNRATILDLNESNELKDIFEKQIEDFYRLVRQNRRFFIPRETSYSNVKTHVQIFDRITNVEKASQRISINELLKKYDDSNDDAVFEIAKYYETRLKSDTVREKKEVRKFYLDELSGGEVLVRPKTYKQKTQTLPHYFKGDLITNAVFSIQFIIDDDDTNVNEAYESYLKINNANCEIFEGQSDSPDIVIYAKSGVWDDILSGRRTAQKSFMTGQLKVKGNFVLLTKFDQLFDPVL